MKSIEEIQNILVNELWDNLDKIKSAKPNLAYYNEFLGDTSFILVGLLELLLISRFSDWDKYRWIDDCLITKVKTNDSLLSIWGIVISGIKDGTGQFTEPFYLEIELNQNTCDFNRYLFLFSDLNRPVLSYQSFRENRDYWDKQYYKTDYWDVSERYWKYIINSEPS
jgi:hypothetical protein